MKLTNIVIIIVEAIKITKSEKLCNHKFSLMTDGLNEVPWAPETHTVEGYKHNHRQCHSLSRYDNLWLDVILILRCVTLAAMLLCGDDYTINLAVCWPQRDCRRCCIQRHYLHTPIHRRHIVAILLPPPLPPYSVDMDIVALYHLHTPWTQPYSPLALVSDCEKDDRKHRSCGWHIRGHLHRCPRAHQWTACCAGKRYFCRTSLCH